MFDHSFDSVIIIIEDIKYFLLHMKDKQEFETIEQKFALFGQVSISDDNQIVIHLNKCEEDSESAEKLDTSVISRDLLQCINSFLNNNQIRNKVLLLGYIRPLRKDIEVKMSDEKRSIMESINDLANNSLKVRKNRLNLSLGDVASLIDYQKQATRHNLILEVCYLRKNLTSSTMMAILYNY